MSESQRESIPSKVGADLDLTVSPRINGFDIGQNGCIIFIDDEQLRALSEFAARIEMGGE